MKEQLSKLIMGFTSFWNAQAKKRKIIILSILGGVVILAVGLAIFLNRPQYVTLYSGLPVEEAREVVAELDGMGVKNQVLDSGQTIKVLKGSEAKARMDLSTMGFPKSPLQDYSWLEKGQGLFVTDAQNKQYINVQNQERLQATIKSLDNVEDCTVILKVPDDRGTVLTVNQKPPTASVTVKVKPDSFLTSKQISGIRRLILTANPGMVDENITLTDSMGNELTPSDGLDLDPNASINLTRNRQRFQQEIEGAMEDAISNQLLGAYGPGNYSVAVSSKLNFNKEVSERTTYSPSNDDGSGMVQHVDKESASGSGGSPEGVVGTDPNAEETYPTADGTDNQIWSKNYSSTSMLVNTLREQIEKEDYTFDTLTVSVVIYRDFLSQDVLAQLTNTVAMAAGVVPENVSVIALPAFDAERAAATSPYPFGMNQTQFFVMMTVLLILIIMFTVMYMSVSKKALRKRRSLEQAIYEAAKAAGDRGPVLSYFGSGDPALDDVASLADAQSVESKEEAVRREIGEFAHASPEIVAQLLKSWLHDEEENQKRR